LFHVDAHRALRAHRYEYAPISVGHIELEIHAHQSRLAVESSPER
jgi:hypothetical protein